MGFLFHEIKINDIIYLQSHDPKSVNLVNKIFPFKVVHVFNYKKINIPFTKVFLNCKYVGESLTNEKAQFGIEKRESSYYIDRIKRVIRPSYVNKRNEVLKLDYSKGQIITQIIFKKENGEKTITTFDYNRTNKELLWIIKDNNDWDNDGIKEYKFVLSCKEI